jgi:mevalonate kinase
MYNSIINTSENQIDVNVTVSEDRTRSFGYGEVNESHIIEYNSSKEIQSTMVTTDGLGTSATVATASAFGNEGRVVLLPDGTIEVYYNNVKLN